MKKIKLSLLIMIFSFNVNAAFTEPEMSQLNEINKKYINKEIESKVILKSAIKESIANLPSEKNKYSKITRAVESGY